MALKMASLSKMKYTVTILLVMTHYVSSQPNERTDKNQVLKSTEAQWGDWSPWVFCKTGVYAKGIGLKIEENNGGALDDTSANAFSLICGDDELIRANNDGPIGREYDVKCKSDSKIIGFKTKVEAPQGAGMKGSADDTALNSVRAMCSNTKTISINKNGYGDWGKVDYCSKDSKVCGFRQKVEKSGYEIGFDNKGLTGVELACCGPKLLGTPKSSEPICEVYKDEGKEEGDFVIKYEKAPEYIIDTSQPAEVYLEKLCNDFKKKKNVDLELAYSKIMGMLPSFKIFGKTVAERFEQIAASYYENKKIPEPYLSELKYYAKCTDNSIVKAVKLNILYEFAYFCTSIVVVDRDGHIIHGRNFDFPNMLKDFTIHYKYVDNLQDNNVLYESLGLFAFVGVHSAVKPKKFGVSMNLRKAFDLWNNVIAIMGQKLPSSWLLRECLIKDNSYNECKERLLSTPILAPCYYIISGTDGSRNGAIIARSPAPDKPKKWYSWRKLTKWQKIKELNDTRWFLVETNYDDWMESDKFVNKLKAAQKKIKEGKFFWRKLQFIKGVKSRDDRLPTAIRELNAIGQHDINIDNIFRILTTPPIKSYNTILTAIWSPSYSLMDYVNVSIPRKVYEMPLPNIDQSGTQTSQQVIIIDKHNNNNEYFLYTLIEGISIFLWLVIAVIVTGIVSCVIAVYLGYCCMRKYSEKVKDWKNSFDVKYDIVENNTQNNI